MKRLKLLAIIIVGIFGIMTDICLYNSCIQQDILCLWLLLNTMLSLLLFAILRSYDTK